MSFDRLQSLIKTTKCPLALELSPEGEESAEEFSSLALSLMDALRGVVPALRLSLGRYARLGWQGVRTMEELLAQGRERDFFTILDAPLWKPSALPFPFSADCLAVSGYQGSDSLRPLLEESRREGRSLFVLAHTETSGAGELQELVAGDRLVYQVVGDLAQRLGREDLGSLGYSRLGIVVEGMYPSDLRSLRKRWEQSFLMVSGPAEDVRFAFDRYGRGAVVTTAEPVRAAREGGGDPAAARERAEKLREELKGYVTVL